MTKPRKKPLTAVQRWRKLPEKDRTAVAKHLRHISEYRNQQAMRPQHWSAESIAAYRGSARAMLLAARVLRELGTPRRSKRT